MRIRHRLLNRGVTQDPLQRDDVPAVHHEMRGERVPHDMRGLPFG